MPDPVPPTSLERVVVQVLYIGDACQRATNLAGHLNGYVGADVFTAMAAAAPPGSLRRDMCRFAAFGPALLKHWQIVSGTGRHRPGPSEDVSGTWWARLGRMWSCALSEQAESHEVRRQYVDERWSMALAHYEDAGAAGALSFSFYVGTAVIGGTPGHTVGGVIGALRWAAARSIGRRESLWEDIARDADECAAIVGCATAIATGLTFGLAHGAALQGSRIALAAVTGAAAGALALGAIPFHYAVAAYQRGRALLRPRGAAAAPDLEAGLLPRPEAAVAPLPAT